MEKSVSAVRRLIRDATGATAVEYAIMAAAIAAVVVAVVFALGGQVESKFDCAHDHLVAKDAAPATCP